MLCTTFPHHIFSIIQFITYMFLHGGAGHLFSNLLGLIFFGPRLEWVWGSNRFLFFYFFTAIGAGIFYSLIRYLEISPMESVALQFLNNPSPELFEMYVLKFFPYKINSNFLELYRNMPYSETLIIEAKNFVRDSYFSVVNSPTIGASGAIFGILMAFAMLFPNTEIFIFLLPITVKAKYLVAFYGLYEILMGIEKTQGDNIAHFAHVGGMIFAFILVTWWRKKSRSFW